MARTSRCLLVLSGAQCAGKEVLCSVVELLCLLSVLDGEGRPVGAFGKTLHALLTADSPSAQCAAEPPGARVTRRVSLPLKGQKVPSHQPLGQKWP